MTIPADSSEVFFQSSHGMCVRKKVLLFTQTVVHHFVILFQSKVLNSKCITWLCGVTSTCPPIEKLAQLTLLGCTEQYFNKAYFHSALLMSLRRFMSLVTTEDEDMVSLNGEAPIISHKLWTG